MHNVYLENLCVFFCFPSELPSQVDGRCVIRENSSSTLKSLSDSLISGEITSDVYVVGDDPCQMLSRFSSLFRQITAGGGLVCRDGKYLMIFRRGLWDIPKGKQEENETIEECAVREVVEETGLEGVTIGSRICVTHHIYKLDGVFCVKHTHWFRMSYDGTGMPVPQLEEEITRAEWMDMSEVAARTASSYRSIREVISNL